MPVFSSLLLQVGFLKILHRYEITFTLPPVRRLSKDIREAPVPSLHLKLLSVMPIPEGVSPSGVLEACPPPVGPDVSVRIWGTSSQGYGTSYELADNLVVPMSQASFLRLKPMNSHCRPASTHCLMVFLVGKLPR